MRTHAHAAVACTKERAWHALAALERLHEWAPDVTESPSDPLRVGAVRRARLTKPAQGKEVLVERVVAITPGTSFTYEIEGGIGPLKQVVTTWRLEDGGEHCTVTVESDVRLAPLLVPLVKRSWRKTLQRLADGFAAWAPTA